MAEKIIFRKRNSILKHVEIFFIKCIISLKENKEYKTQLWFVILFDTILFFMMMIFYIVYGNLVFEFLEWSSYDFMVFFLIQLLTAKVLWLHFLRYFSTRLVRGDLNQVLVKPVNSYFFTNTLQINGANIVTGIVLFFIIVFFLIFGHYNNILLASLIWLIGTIFYIVYYNFFASLAFFMKSSDYILDMANSKLNFVVEEYTPKLFLNSGFRWIAFLLPGSFYGFFTIEALKGRFDLLFKFLPFILLFWTVLTLFLVIAWKIGLKRYEAYG